MSNGLCVLSYPHIQRLSLNETSFYILRTFSCIDRLESHFIGPKAEYHPHQEFPSLMFQGSCRKFLLQVSFIAWNDFPLLLTIFLVKTRAFMNFAHVVVLKRTLENFVNTKQLLLLVLVISLHFSIFSLELCLWHDTNYFRGHYGTKTFL